MEKWKRAPLVSEWEAGSHAKESPQTSIVQSQLDKEMTLRAGRNAIPPGKSLITQGSPSYFRDGMLSVHSSSSYKYSKLCYIMSFIHCHYGKVWLENCTFETNITQFTDSWNKHWMKQISQIPERFLETFQPYVFSRYEVQYTLEIYIIKVAPSNDSFSYSELRSLHFCSVDSSPEEFPAAEKHSRSTTASVWKGSMSLLY